MNPDKLATRSLFLNFTQRHSRVLVWICLYLITILICSRHLSWIGAVVTATVTMTPMVLLGAIFYHLLLPHMRDRRRLSFILMSIVIVVVLIIVATATDIIVFRYFTHSQIDAAPEEIRANADSSFDGRIFLHVKYTFLLLSTAMVVTISYMIDERKRQLAAFREQQMQEQVKYLRAQINPHFLFNALNCIYTLTMIQDEKAPDSVLKLSEMLRYVIDDCRSDEVLLSKEIKYIQNYIDFQRIRMEQEPDLTFDVQVADPNYKIPPMILQPIIENCFKHSRLVDDPHAWVHISVRQNDSGLLFTCDNSKPAATSFSRQTAITGRQDEERTGIGLMNVQQRLNVLFGNQCSLKVIEDDKHYKTILHI